MKQERKKTGKDWNENMSSNLKSDANRIKEEIEKKDQGTKEVKQEER